MRCLYSLSSLDEKATEKVFKKTVVSFFCMHFFISIVCLFYCILFMQRYSIDPLPAAALRIAAIFFLLNTVLNVAGASVYSYILIKPLRDFAIKMQSSDTVSSFDMPSGLSEEIVEIFAAFNRLTSSLSALRSAVGEPADGQKYIEAVQTIVHDLKKPFLLAKLLLQNSESGATVMAKAVHRDSLKKMMDNADTIIDGILLGGKSVRVRRESVDLNEVIYDAILVAAGSFLDKKVDFRYSLNHTRCAHIDPVQIARIFVNLFANALELMPSGSEIVVGTQDSLDASLGNRVEISIRNTGTFVDEEHIGKIFDMFFTSKSAHCGLGLAICKQILEDHGSKIVCKSDRYTGTSFSFELEASHEIRVPNDSIKMPSCMDDVRLAVCPPLCASMSLPSEGEGLVRA